MPNETDSSRGVDPMRPADAETHRPAARRATSGGPLPVDPEIASRFSANLAGFFIPPPESMYRWISAALPGDPLVALNDRMSLGMGGFEVFVGFPALLLGALGLRHGASAYVRRAALVACVFWLLSLGPTLKVFGLETGWPLPFAALHEVHPFDQSRTPVRFSVVAMFLWTLPAASGMRALGRLAGRRGPPGRVSAVAALTLWTLFEAWSPATLFARLELPVEKVRRGVADGPVLCLPVDYDWGHHAALQILHGQPISSGYLARQSAEQVELRDRLRAALRDGSEDLASLVVGYGYRTILVTEPLPRSVLSQIESLPVKIVALRDEWLILVDG